MSTSPTTPRILVLSLGGTITMVSGAGGGITPRLGAAELMATIPALAEVAEIEALSPLCVASASLTVANLIDVARRIEAAFADGADGAVVVQGTDTIEESAFILDLLIGGERPVVVTGAMRGAGAPGADGPANLLAAVRVAAAPAARGLGTLVVLNDTIHAARFVQKSHNVLPSAFLSPLAGALGTVMEGRARFYMRVARNPGLSAADGPPRPVALVKAAMGDEMHVLKALADSDCAGVVIEGMGAGHVHVAAIPIVDTLAARLPVVLASRVMAGAVFTSTYGYPGGEIDLIGRGLIPAGYLSGLKARLLLGLALRTTRDRGAIGDYFAIYN